jgi:hypothetical protein
MNFRIITDEGDGFILQIKRGPLFWKTVNHNENPYSTKTPRRFATISEAKQHADLIVREAKEPTFTVVEEFHIY